MRIPSVRASDVKGVVEQLRQPFELDPGTLEYLVERSKAIAYDGPVRVACSLLSEPILNDVERANLGEFIRRGATDSRAITASFEHSVRSLGRCPIKDRPWLRAQLEPVKLKPQPAQ